MPNLKVDSSNHKETSNVAVITGHGFKSRTVYNTSKSTNESANWRLDWYRLNNVSYAQVAKMATKSKVTQVVKNDSVITKIRDGVVDCSSKTVNHQYTHSTEVLPKNDSKCRSHNSTAKVKKGQVKVSHEQAWGQHLQCKNKFAVLPVDAVVSDTVSESSKNASDIKKSEGQVTDTGDNCKVRVVKSRIASTDDASDKKSPESPQINHGEVDSCTKYDLPLRIKNKSMTYKHVLPACPTLQLWDVQNKFKFSFIPLGSQLMPDHICPVDLDTDPIALHKIMQDSNEYNFLQNQINLKSQLNPDIWDSYLHDYWDKQLPLLIRFGFPLDYNREGTLRSQETNHASAIEFPDDIQAYLQEEGHYNAILGPFKDIPIKNMHVSPMMTREKPNAPHRRVIIDLSFPHGHSINAGIPKDQYLGTPFILKLPTVDTITDQIKVLGRGCKLYKVDISRAFRHVKLDPKEYDLLGLCHERYYVDTCLPFGYRNGSALFQRLSDAVRHIMRQRNFDVINYIDDILGIGLPSQIDASFDALCQLLQDLGFQVSEKKLETPTTCLNCLGILINTETFTMSIPPLKLAEILDKCSQWQEKSYCNKRQLQSLLGSLLYISKCVRSSRFFLNRLLDVLRSMEDKKQIPICIPLLKKKKFL